MNFTRMHNDYLDPDRHIIGWCDDEREDNEGDYDAEQEKPAFTWEDDPDYPTCAMDYYGYADNLDENDIPIIYW